MILLPALLGHLILLVASFSCLSLTSWPLLVISNQLVIMTSCDLILECRVIQELSVERDYLIHFVHES